MLQVIEDPVHLVKLPFLVFVLNSQLVTIGLAYGSILVCPAVPDMGMEIADPV